MPSWRDGSTGEVVRLLERPWPGVLDEETSTPRFRELLGWVDAERSQNCQEVYPCNADMFAAFRLTKFEEIKVVILGQDPYPNPRQAMGLAFSVPRDVPKPRSLVNISAAMEGDGLGPLGHGDLTSWAKQGMLLLNTALTVPRGKPGAHLAAWRPFTDAVLRRINDRPEPVVFVLWGTKAQKFEKRVPIDTNHHGLVTAPHPASRGQAQLRFRQGTFTRINSELDRLEIRKVAWSGAPG